MDNPGLNLLVTVKGGVRLKRREWSDYHTAGFGAELHRGDLLRVSDDATALVLCDGLTTWEVPPGAPAGLNNGCPPPPEPVLVRGASLVGNTRGGNDPFIPYIISPRKTKLIDDEPLLRWNEIPNATSYEVSVRGEGVNWSTTTAETQIVYPGDPPLQLGQTYALIVDADTGVYSRDEGVPGLGFTLLEEKDAADIKAIIEKIETLGLEEDAQALAITQFMAGNELIAEAIATLESVIAQGSEAPAVYRMLGDLYRQIALNLIAAEHYDSAIAFAEAAGNIEDGAAAKVGLAEVNISLGDKEVAIQLLQDAIEAYQTLGDTETVTELEAKLALLAG